MLTTLLAATCMSQPQMTYNEQYRPQFHFSAKKNWLNDPNGLVLYKGEYHLFFQYNPTGLKWGNMHWGHAVSPDLLHWTELSPAIEPDEHGTAFSGSAAVDWKDTSRLGSLADPPLVILYTAAGSPFTQCLASSTDRGRTWAKWPSPVLDHIVGENRDPRIFWFKPTHRWVMALYLDGNQYGIFDSPDLHKWTERSRLNIADTSECPDLFPLGSKWVFLGANGHYLVGSFDGHSFAREAGPFAMEHGPNFYASQTWNDVPGRRVQIGWMNASDPLPGMPFTNQMSFPCELSLHGDRVYRYPIKEIEKLWGKATVWKDRKVSGNVPVVADSDTYDIDCVFSLGSASDAGLTVRGQVIRCTADHRLECFGRSVELPVTNGQVNLRILLDRSSLEVFGNHGQVSMTGYVTPDATDHAVDAFANNGAAKFASLKVRPVKSVWH